MLIRFFSQICFYFTIAFFRLFKYSVFDVYMNVTLPSIMVVSVKLMWIAKNQCIIVLLLAIFLFSVVFFSGFYFSFALKLLAHSPASSKFTNKNLGVTILATESSRFAVCKLSLITQYFSNFAEIIWRNFIRHALVLKVLCCNHLRMISVIWIKTIDSSQFEKLFVIITEIFW